LRQSVSASPTLLWFRQDLRLQDNLALQAAVARGAAIVPIYILDDDGEGRWPMGGASRWWLHHALASLDASLREAGSRLVIAHGNSAEVLRNTVRATGAGAIFWNRRYEPTAIARDRAIKAEFTAAGLEAKSFNGALLNEPHTITNKSGGPFQVFTPYWRHCLTLPVTAAVKFAAQRLTAPEKWPRSLELAELALLPKIKWDAGFAETWQPGEAGAAKRLRQFTAGAMDEYADRRNLPDRDGTSMLSRGCTPANCRRGRCGRRCRRSRKTRGCFRRATERGFS
jgi:deoxyribodipyrimidine photo-lyase